MLHRIELPRSAAIEASHELWPDRAEDSCDIVGYLQWHEKVRPGGELHPRNGSSQSADLVVRGKSIKELSQSLIVKMDHFHRAGGTTDPVSGTPPGGSITPLETFFNSVRYYIM
jgi:hypothetical protein